ncbi:HTTM domain-containing protein [Halovenus sp. HT40]|uniref:HTTM domain-containing protein n=1 Tax=Halovenus sp. HT40 TaxID=3126691 RepID=UPI00300F6F10
MSTASRETPDWLAARLGIDGRALAAFRIALGVVLLVDVLTRARHLRALYTDAGIVPRSSVLAEYGGVYEVVLSLPDPWFPVLLFPIGALCALALIAGVRPRLAAFGALLTLVLLQMRNPFVLNGGDVILRILVIWALFLPLGQHSLREPDSPDRVVSVATAGLVLQVVIVYVVNATHKLDSEAWRAGTAVADVFRTEQYTYLLADWIGEWLVGSGLLTLGTYAWFALLLASPLLLLSTGRLRTGLVSAFILFHAGMLLTLSVGHFPLVSITGLLVLYPSSAWDWLAHAGRRIQSHVEPLSIGAGVVDSTADRWNSLSRPVRQRGRSLRSAVPKPVRHTTRRLVLSGLPAIIVVFSLLSAAGAAGVVDTPDSADSAVETADLGQDWRMFAPDPPDHSWWIATPATRPDGSSVDAFHDESLAPDSPAQADRMASFRWRKYFQKIRHEEGSIHHAEYARYLCANRNIDSVAIYHGYQSTDPGRTEFGGETLASFECTDFAD